MIWTDLHLRFCLISFDFERGVEGHQKWRAKELDWAFHVFMTSNRALSLHGGVSMKNGLEFLLFGSALLRGM